MYSEWLLFLEGLLVLERNKDAMPCDECSTISQRMKARDKGYHNEVCEDSRVEVGAGKDVYLECLPSRAEEEITTVGNKLTAYLDRHGYLPLSTEAQQPFNHATVTYT